MELRGSRHNTAASGVGTVGRAVRAGTESCQVSGAERDSLSLLVDVKTSMAFKWIDDANLKLYGEECVQMPDVLTLTEMWARANCVHAGLRAKQVYSQLKLEARRREIAAPIPESPCDSRFPSFTSSAASPGVHGQAAASPHAPMDLKPPSVPLA